MYNMDAAVLRNLILVWGLSALSGLAAGLSPALLRCAARRNDPSPVTALFATAMAVFSCLFALVRGGFRLPAGADIFYVILATLATAVTWLSLTTALTGGIVSKVIPGVALSYILSAFLLSFFSGKLLGTWQMCAFILVLLGALMIESRTKKFKRQYWIVYTVIAALGCTALSLLQSTRFAQTDPSLFHLWRTAPACLIVWVFTLARGRQRLLLQLPKKVWTGALFSALCIVLGWVLSGLIAGRSAGGFSVPLEAMSFLFAMLFARIVCKEKQPGSAVFGAVLMLTGMAIIAVGY